MKKTNFISLINIKILVEYQEVKQAPKIFNSNEEVHYAKKQDANPKSDNCIHDLFEGIDLNCISGNVSSIDRDGNSSVKLVLKSLDTTEYCFTIQYIAQAQTDLILEFKSIQDTTKDEILVIKPNTQSKDARDFIDSQESYFCVRDLLALQWGDIELTLTIDPKVEHFNFGLIVNITSESYDKPEQLTKYRFLQKMDQIRNDPDSHNWSDEWVFSYGKFLSFITSKDHSIRVKGK